MWGHQGVDGLDGSRLMAKQNLVKSVSTQQYRFWDKGKPCVFNNLQHSRTRRIWVVPGFSPESSTGQ